MPRVMHLRVSQTVAFVAACFTVAGSANGADPTAGIAGDYIGIFADAAATQTCASVPPGTGTTLYLVGFRGPATAAGIGGAEFRIVVTNATGYFISYTPPPNAPVVIGDPVDRTPGDDLDHVGVTMGFADCDEQTSDRIPFGTLNVFNFSGGPTELRIQRRDQSSNENYACPVLVNCDVPTFTQSCMPACDASESGAAIAARLRLNVPDCTDTPCAAVCEGAAVVSVGGTVGAPACQNAPLTVTASATNGGSAPADVDVFVEHVLAGSFAAVQPGATVVASRTYELLTCRSQSISIGAVARTVACPNPAGAEIVRNPACSPSCGVNHAPDCSSAFASPSTLWPADGSLVPVEIGGITDPDGDLVSYELAFAFTDEATGFEGTASCPDAFFDGPQQMRLRAERSLAGNGRTYRIHVIGSDNRGGECNTTIDVCVPRKPGFSCTTAPHEFDFLATGCTAATTDEGPRVGPVLDGGSVVVMFEQASENATTVDIYDVRGRRVARIANGRFAPGRHVLRWDGRDAGGREVANGVYVVRVRTADGTATSKVALVR
jgi:hypothetical protein